MKPKNPIRFELNDLRTDKMQAIDELRVVRSQKSQNKVSHITKVKALKVKIAALTQAVNDHKDTYGLIK